MMRRASLDLEENHESGKNKCPEVHMEEVASIRKAAERKLLT